MKRPIIFICVCYILSILMIIYHNVFLIYGVIIAYIIGSIIIRKKNYKKFYKYYLLIPLICFFACINMFLQFGISGGSIDGIVDDEEIMTTCTVHSIEKNDIFNKATCTITRISQKGYSSNKKMKVLVYFDPLDEIQVGDEVNIIGTIHQISGPSNPGEFDSNLYYFSKQIFYKIYVDNYQVTNNKILPNTLYYIREKMKEGIYNSFPKKEAQVISTMILGLKSDLDDEVKDYYAMAGLSHLLAISGLHVSIIGMGLFGFLKKVIKKERESAIISIGFIVFYCLLTGCSISTTRATIMLCIMFLSYVFYKKYDVYAALFLTALILLVINPYQLFDVGFLLSFFAVLGIIYINPILTKHINPNGNKVIGIMVTTLSASLSTYPIVLWYFYKIPTYAITINLLVLPVISLVVLIGVITSVVSCFSIPIARLFAGSVFILLNYIEVCCKVSMMLPFNAIHLGKPKLIFIIIYYILLILVLLKNKIIIDIRLKGVIALGLLALVMIPRIYQYNTLEITFLDVGQGDCCCIRYMGKIYFIDGGGEIFVEGDNTGINVLLPYLEAEGINKIDGMFITHSDFDHICGIIEVIEKVDTDYIVMSSPYEFYQDELCLQLEDVAFSKNVDIIYFDDNDRFEYKDLTLECVYPNRDIISFESNNDRSLVMKLTFHQLSILLTGDIEAQGENYLVSGDEDFSADIIKAPHHGSNTSSSEPFLKAVDAKIAILSYGEHNVFNHPSKSVVRRYKAMDYIIYQTAIDGAIRLKSEYPYDSFNMTTYLTNREDEYTCNNLRN